MSLSLPCSPYTLLTVSAAACLFLYRRFTTKKIKHPPGPYAWPIVGNTFQVPGKGGDLWQYFADLSQLYGPVVRLSLGGENFVILNSKEDAQAILNKKGHNFSSRKHFLFGQQYRSKNKRLLLMPYDSELKKQRAAFYAMLQPRLMGSYEKVQELETKKLVYDLLTQPHELPIRQFKSFAASIVMTMSYGTRSEGLNDPRVTAVESILESFIKDVSPGGHLIDSVPYLDRFLPDFLAPWRADAEAKHQHEIKFYKHLIDEVREKMQRGVAPDCFAARMLDQQVALGMDDLDVAYTVGTAFEAGTGNVASSIAYLLLACLDTPSIVTRAHEEFDNVLGQDTVPTLEHFYQLPFLRAVTKEVYRWRPPGPGAFPHTNDEDDTYLGYDIPKGTQVIGNIGAIHKDNNNYADAHRFNPDRWMTREEVETNSDSILLDGHYTFGWGRRICPARYLAARSLFITSATILYYFNIEQDVDPRTGLSYEINGDWPSTDGVTIEPQPFPVRLVPRSPGHAARIRSEWEGAEKMLKSLGQ